MAPPSAPSPERASLLTPPPPPPPPPAPSPLPRLLLALLALVALVVLLPVLRDSLPRPLSIVRRRVWHHARRIRGHAIDCRGKHFKKRTLRLVSETPISAYFGDALRKYGLSDLASVPAPPGGRRDLLAVLDNSFDLVRVTPAQLGAALAPCARGLPVATCNATWVRWPSHMRTTKRSSFEYVAYNASSRSFLVGSETARRARDAAHVSRIYDVRVPSADGADDRVAVQAVCDTDHVFSHPNKGIEGAVVATVGGRSLLLALCEGNFCDGGERGRRPGNGRLLVLERETRRDSDGNARCAYATRDVLRLPAALDFQDYAAISVWRGDTVAIVSQENAALFVGKLKVDGAHLSIGDGRVFDFPRSDECEIKYCNIEGIVFLDRYLVATVSDTMKAKGKQDFRCRDKDESFQVFRIPR